MDNTAAARQRALRPHNGFRTHYGNGHDSRPHRRKFDGAGKLIPTHGAYPEAVRAVAVGEHVPLLDLERATATWLQATGDEPSRRFFMWIEPGKYPKIPDGRKDDTHFVAAGAEAVAGMAAAQIREQNLPLARWLKP